ncbi:MAG TPA: YbaK/EbsC family protein [Candidatus Faecivicinus avistercoris]|nr:YbaK/EbsC family protein [Candidatus Faecivicinus avistercoris]
MSIERVRAFMRERNMEDRILEFDVSSATVALAAEAVGCAPERIAKTLSFLVDGGAVLVVAAGDARVDNPKFKAQFHTKAKMLTPEEVVNLVGHAVGGVCPFAVNEGVKVYLDESLRRFETVFPACGSSNSAIELTLSELEQLSGGEWIDVCKLPA